MSIRDALKKSVSGHSENVLRCSGAKQTQHATNTHDIATAPATNDATMSPEASKHGDASATSGATNPQQPIKTSATNPQQQAHRTATPAEADELAALIREVYFDWQPEDREQAIKVAIADVDDALICFRDLWQRMKSGAPHPYMNQKRLQD